MGSSSFLTTRWSLVAGAGNGMAREGSRAALEELCRSYWSPLYAYLLRRGEDPEDARDLVQGFFADLLERRDLGKLEPGRGRFRGWLLAGLKHHHANVRREERALKRGGGVIPIEFDTASVAAPPSDLDPERVFERAWALAVLERALERLERSYRADGRGRIFEVLRSWLVADAEPGTLSEAARELDIGDGATKVALHRLRGRYREALRAEVAETLEEGGDVEEELAQLRAALG